jgi:hypothetical protein
MSENHFRMPGPEGAFQQNSFRPADCRTHSNGQVGVSAVVGFLEGSGPDGAGRTVAQVLAFDRDALERHHVFIQWLFPLAEKSAAVLGSPVLSQTDIAEIRGSAKAQWSLMQAAEAMADFYETTTHWLTPTDHNHLRVTRIIKSLRLLCADAAADYFRERVLLRVRATGAPVSKVSRDYWVKA